MIFRARQNCGRARRSNLAIALIVSGLAACEGGVQSDGPALTRDFDGSWSFEFESTTPAGLNGSRCLDGAGQVTVQDGRVVGATFAEFEGDLRSMGALEGQVLEAEGDVVMTIASSQSGRNAFVARGAETEDGFAGTWEDIHECSGTFSAIRSPDAGAGSS